MFIGRQREIDELERLYGSGKFQCIVMYGRRRVGADAVDTLIERGELFQYRKKYYYLFAKTGFTDAASAKADYAGNIALVAFEDFLLPQALAQSAQVVHVD